MDLDQFIDQYKKLIDSKNIDFLNSLSLADTLKKSILYSYQAGGKRIRPLLLLATIHAFNDEIVKGIHTSCALELVHTSSLIHDDLPAMDDDDYRRGMLTNHKVFGEATAILAGDALLVNAFNLISQDSLLTAKQKVDLINQLASCSGANGMIGGQQLDMESENQNVSIDELMKIHENKTGKLLQFSLLAGGIITKQTKKVISTLKEIACHIGIAFQIKDDILDVEGSYELLGKEVNSDVKNHKNTYVSLLGLSKAKEKLFFHYESAVSLIKQLNIQSNLMEDIFKLIIERNK